MKVVVVDVVVVVMDVVLVAVVDLIEIQPTTRVHLVTVHHLVVKVVLKSPMVDLLRDVVVMVVLVVVFAVIAKALLVMEIRRMEDVHAGHMTAAAGQGMGKIFLSFYYFIFNGLASIRFIKLS